MSHGFGSTKQLDSCSARNFAARDVWVDFIAQHYAAPARAVLPVLRSAAHFPDLPQSAVSAVDRIVIGNWKSCDSALGFWAFSRQTAKQVPLPSIGGSSHNTKIRTRADVVLCDSRLNENDV